MAGSAGLAWETADVLTATRLNQKNTFMGTGAQILALTPTYPGMLAFCTSSGSGFVINSHYKRNTANTSWTNLTAGQSGDQVYPIDVTIGNYASPTSPVATSTAPAPTADFIEAYTTNAGWTQVGTTVTVDSGTVDKLDFALAPSNADHRVHKSLGFTLSNTSWSCEFDVVFSVIQGNAQAHPVIFTAGTAKPKGSQDALGVWVSDVGGANDKIGMFKNDAGTYDISTLIAISPTGTYYCTLQRSSTTNLRLSVFSDSTRTTHITSSPINFTIASTITGLTHIQHSSDDGAGADAISLTIDNTSVWNGANNYNATNAITIDTFKWLSSAVNNPAIYFDMGAAKELHAIALNVDKTSTTETEIQIRASTDTTFTSPEVIRTILISDFTDDTTRFITIPRAITDKRYIQVYGSSNAVALGINFLAYLTKSVADFEKGHFHQYINSTDNNSSLDSN